MAGAVTNRIYFEGFRLWREPLDAPLQQMQRTSEPQIFQGADRARALVVPTSPNLTLELTCRCLGYPNPTSKDRKGWVATKQALDRELGFIAGHVGPVVWVEDDTRSKTVASVISPQITRNAHGFVNGDIVLVRRNGVTAYSLAVVSSAAANTFIVSSVIANQALHAILAGDEIHLVEAYWLGMVLRGHQLVDEKGWMAKEVVYSFVGSGSTQYSRTSASTVGD